LSISSPQEISAVGIQTALQRADFGCDFESRDTIE
jgi:hypothetical protein